MNTSDIALFIGLGALIAALLGALMALRLRKELLEQGSLVADLQRQLAFVSQSISGLTGGAVGVDRRLQALETRERLLSERQETYEIQQADEQPYGHAIRMVQQGASVGRLVQELDLSESEAELIVRLHGRRELA